MFFKNITDDNTIPHIKKPLLIGQEFSINNKYYGRAGWHLAALVRQGNIGLHLDAPKDICGENDGIIIPLQGLDVIFFKDKSFLIFCQKRIVPFSFSRNNATFVWAFEDGLQRLLAAWQDINAACWKIAQPKDRFSSWPQDYILPGWANYAPYHATKQQVPQSVKDITRAIHVLFSANLDTDDRRDMTFSLKCSYLDGYVDDFTLTFDHHSKENDLEIYELLKKGDEILRSLNNLGVKTAHRIKNAPEFCTSTQTVIGQTGAALFYSHTHPAINPTSHDIMQAKALLFSPRTTHANTVQTLDMG